MPGFHLVILGPVEPSPDLVDVINSPLFEGRLFYIVGSALNYQDLVKARVDTATAIMFMSNPELDNVGTVLDDAATVLRTMSVMNFNPDLDTLVQVLRSSDRDLLKDSDASIVLCMDDYKTALQARNAMCPGLATFVENLFQSFGSGRDAMEKPTDLWLSEYKYGLQMELYYIPLDKDLLAKLNFNWRLLVEAIYLEYDCMLLGVCRASDRSVCLNPGSGELQKCRTFLNFFQEYSTGILLAPDDDSANAIAFAMTDSILSEDLLNHLVSAEENFRVRVKEALAVASCDGKSSTSLGAKAFRRVSISLSRGVGNSSHTETPQGRALVCIKQAQNALDGEFKHSVDAAKSTNNKMSASPKDSKDDEDDSDFLGYIDFDSDDSQRKDTVLDHRDNVCDSVDATLPEGKNLKRDAWNGEGNIVAQNENVSQHSRVVAKCNIHGDEDYIDDASSLNLLNSPIRNDSIANFRREGTSTALKIKPRSAISHFRNAARIATALSSIPSPSKKKLKNENDMTEPISAEKYKDNGSKLNRTFSVNLKMEGFKRKKASSYEEEDIENISLEAEKRINRPIRKGITKVKDSLHSIEGSRSADSEKKSHSRDDDMQHFEFGHSPIEIKNAANLRNHVIVMGCVDNVVVFLKELRMPQPTDLCYHPVLVVAEDLSNSTWSHIKKRFNDVYLMRGRARSCGEQELTSMNIESAHSLVLLASRQRNSADDATNIDAAAIFTYLKLQKYVPRHVFFTVELFLASSIGPLDSLVMRHIRISEAEGKKDSEEANPHRAPTGISVSSSRQRGSIIKIGGNVDTPLLFQEMFLRSLSVNNSAMSVEMVSELVSRASKTRQPGGMSGRSTKGSEFDESRSYIFRDNSLRRRGLAVSSTDSCSNLLLQENVLKKSKYAKQVNDAENLKKQEKTNIASKSNLFWDTQGTHYTLPVIASSLAFVPTGFDSIFCNVRHIRIVLMCSL